MHQIKMLQNKIYQNFIKEILKTFLLILFGLTIIAWTVRAVNFLDLIVESGYSVSTYFQYSFLNLFGIFSKFFLELSSIERGETAIGNGFRFPRVISISISAKVLFVNTI